MPNATSQAAPIAFPGAEKKLPHAVSTVELVNAVSSPPMTVAVTSASTVIVTVFSWMARRRMSPNERWPSGCSSGSASGGGVAAGSVAGGGVVMTPPAMWCPLRLVGLRGASEGSVGSGGSGVCVACGVCGAAVVVAPSGAAPPSISGSGPNSSAWPPSAPPAISRPSSAAGTSGSRKPVILPSYMTAIRSASA